MDVKQLLGDPCLIFCRNKQDLQGIFALQFACRIAVVYQEGEMAKKFPSKCTAVIAQKKICINGVEVSRFDVKIQI